MKRMISRIAVVIFLGFSSIEARIINIPADYSTIQAGIDTSANGDTVLVAPGTYVENINFNGHSIILASEFILTGDTTDIISTIIDGGNVHAVITINTGEMPETAIIGLTIRNGRGDNHYYAFSGGGVYCESTDVRISNNIITHNIVQGFGDFGGGIACLNGADCIIHNNLITENRSGEGGGIYCYNANPYIIDNIISYDTARFSGEDGWGGGGIRLQSSNAFISGNLILGNVGDLGGGGIRSGLSAPIIINNIIYGNSSGSYGGALYFGNSDATVINTICWNNIGTEIYTQSSHPTIIYCDLQHGWQDIGNITADPLFRDTANGDFHLMSTACGDSADSPCIDAGVPDSLDQILDCLHGLGTSRSDMGAYGGNNSGQITGIGGHADMSIPDIITLSQNYPNPFNASTTIYYFLPKAADVRIDIFDILGRKIETLANGFQLADSHQITWNADARSTGIYFYKIQAGNFSEAKKMLLIK